MRSAIRSERQFSPIGERIVVCSFQTGTPSLRPRTLRNPCAPPSWVKMISSARPISCQKIHCYECLWDLLPSLFRSANVSLIPVSRASTMRLRSRNNASERMICSTLACTFSDLYPMAWRGSSQYLRSKNKNRNWPTDHHQMLPPLSYLGIIIHLDFPPNMEVM